MRGISAELRSETLRAFYDCEFYEDGHTVDLISMAFVAEDGRELYMISGEFWLGRYNDGSETARWLTDNVLPSLPVVRDPGGRLLFDAESPDYVNHVYSRAAMRAKILEFLKVGPGFPELWANYGAYDHIALCQLWGDMRALPADLPQYTNDLQQLLRSHVINQVGLPQQHPDEQHNALADARHLKKCYDYAKGIINARQGMFTSVDYGPYAGGPRDALPGTA